MADLAAMMVAASSGAKVYTAYLEGQNARDTLRQNSRALTADAAARQQLGDWQAQQVAERGRRLIGEQKVGFAKSGVLPTGTPLLVRAQTERSIAEDEANVRFATAVDVAAKESQARELRRQARFAQRAGLWRMGETVMTGVNETYKAGRNAGWWKPKEQPQTIYSGIPSDIGSTA